MGQCSTEKIRREEISKEKVKKKMISGEAYAINKQTVYRSVWCAFKNYVVL